MDDVAFEAAMDVAERNQLDRDILASTATSSRSAAVGRTSDGRSATLNARGLTMRRDHTLHHASQRFYHLGPLFSGGSLHDRKVREVLTSERVLSIPKLRHVTGAGTLLQ
jgi:hypothetical protein